MFMLIVILIKEMLRQQIFVTITSAIMVLAVFITYSLGTNLYIPIHTYHDLFDKDHNSILK